MYGFFYVYIVGGVNIFTITKREIFSLATVIILYVNLDVLLQIIVGKNTMTTETLKNRFMKIAFSIYMSLLISIIYFPLPIAWDKYIVYKKPNINIIPWESIIWIYKKYGVGEVIKNIGGNLLLLSPLIFFICYYFKKLRFNIKSVLIISLTISLFIECSQVTISMIIPNYARTFDTIDLICNSISGVIGYKLYTLYKKIIIDIDSEVHLFQ